MVADASATSPASLTPIQKPDAREAAMAASVRS
jgi:hypothetical protein